MRPRDRAHRRCSSAKRRLFIQKRLNSGKRGNPALKQVRHPTHCHHRPGHYEQVTDESDEVPRRDRPGYRQPPSENQHQQHTGVPDEPGHREKRPVDNRQLEIVSYESFAHLGKPPAFEVLPGYRL